MDYQHACKHLFSLSLQWEGILNERLMWISSKLSMSNRHLRFTLTPSSLNRMWIIPQDIAFSYRQIIKKMLNVCFAIHYFIRMVRVKTIHGENH